MNLKDAKALTVAANELDPGGRYEIEFIADRIRGEYSHAEVILMISDSSDFIIDVKDTSYAYYKEKRVEDHWADRHP